MNKRKNLWILFSLILVFFFVGCSDFYQDMGGSSIEMSFKVPEKIDERSLVSRSDTETDISTYKLVVKLESKNELLDKIEKNVCSGEIVNLAFTNVTKGKTVKVSAQFFQDGKSVYFGESDWINTTKGKNYAKVVLDTTEEPIVPSIAAQPKGEIVLYSENNHDFTLACASMIVDTSNYEQNLSMQWQEKTNSGWTDIDASRFEDNEITYVTYIDVTLQKNEVRTFRCVVSNYIITPAGKKKTVTVYSNEATVAYIEGVPESISADYIGEYELYGDEVQKENFKVFANYKVGESIQSLPVNDFNVKNENSSFIGNVPHSITYPTSAPTGLTTTISVPVKYQLNADKLAITAFVTNDENTEATDSGSGLNIAQYTQNVQLSANYDDTVSLYTEGTDNSEPINILDCCNINWASDSGESSIGSTNTLTIQDETNALLPGPAIYECTITPKADSGFIVGENVTKQYFVNVCPWEIALTKYQSSNPVGFDNQTLEGGTTYKANLKNEAMDDGATFSDVTYSVYGEGYSIVAGNNDVIQAPPVSTNEQKATIKASWNGKEIASLEVVVPASSTSGGTTGGGTGNTEATVSAEYLTFDSVNREMVVKSYEGLKTVAKIINGEIQEGETISISSSEENGAVFTYSLGDDGLDTIGILLSNNIELDSSWTGIGTEGNPYNGIFNGGNYSIKYNENTKPLFNYAGGSICKIYSLVVNGELTSAEPYLGGIVSSFSGGTIENCVNNAIITNSYSTNDSTATGGIVGYLDNAEAICTIQNCVNLCSISAKTYVGGIVGHGVSSNNAGQSVTVSKCINIGNISSNSTESGAYQAGIMGGSSFNVNYQCISIADCLNKGTIFYNDKTSNGAGIVNNPGQTYVKVTNCINAGPVNTTSFFMISDINYTNSYWDKNVNRYANPDSFTGAKTTEDLVNGVDISTTTFSNWVFNADYSYPYPNIGSSLPAGEDDTIWETVLEALEVDLTSGGGTNTYQIGDVYSENGTAMGIVFEVAEDNSYIKIVALNESPDNLMFAKSGYLTTIDADFFSYPDDGYGNYKGLLYQILQEDLEQISNFPAFEYCYSYYVNNYVNELWVLPAIDELISIIQTNYEIINNALSELGYTELGSNYAYWSSTMVEDTTKAYYCTKSTTGSQQQNVTTSCAVRPILRIDFED